jgi:hypothetical protein
MPLFPIIIIKLMPLYPIIIIKLMPLYPIIIIKLMPLFPIIIIKLMPHFPIIIIKLMKIKYFKILSIVLHVVILWGTILNLLVPTLKHLIVLNVDNIKMIKIIINVGYATVFFVKIVHNTIIHF